jgi:hypothetical protein
MAARKKRAKSTVAARKKPARAPAKKAPEPRKSRARKAASATIASKKKTVARKKSVARTKPVPKAPAKRRKSRGPGYRSNVADTIDEQPRLSSYMPKTVMELSVVRRRALRSVEDLLPVEREQLEAIFRPHTLEEMFPHLDDSLEAAEVVDASGAVVYRLYGWDYGVGYLFSAIGLEVFGFGGQHDIEHWRPEQRDLFVAMDRALRGKDHGFEQPLNFCWADDRCWKESEGKPPGTVGSEPSIRQKLLKALN